MSDLEVRPLELSDEAEWRRLWTAYLAFYETSLPEEVFRKTFARLTGEDGASMAGLLAVSGGRAVGLVHFLFHRSTWSTGDVCYLQDLYADPEVRGMGIGRALVEAVYERAAATGAPEVYWLTQDFNATARRLYDRIATKTPFIVYQKNL
ncbi:ribosomal protein S18 acetylase RimI-like enzyme [Rhizobium subbaraonis]|uniref:Ribosomal protein S18 acetylase RimI-like enzyme n=1 Tax=Rhizobium subbaraonis TaxID=908946 RepID=A0A285U7U4_9HYPH|nr:GNAT family N-acetyltransferase [Rhizobium subbaraonis]SOC37899.1 ribosomal protein S18 acetylase RimI-like enzyme [Rhizobium subbaraonis]